VANPVLNETCRASAKPDSSINVRGSSRVSHERIESAVGRQEQVSAVVPVGDGLGVEHWRNLVAWKFSRGCHRSTSSTHAKRNSCIRAPATSTNAPAETNPAGSTSTDSVGRPWRR